MLSALLPVLSLPNSFSSIRQEDASVWSLSDFPCMICSHLFGTSGLCFFLSLHLSQHTNAFIYMSLGDYRSVAPDMVTTSCTHNLVWSAYFLIPALAMVLDLANVSITDVTQAEASKVLVHWGLQCLLFFRSLRLQCEDPSLRGSEKTVGIRDRPPGWGPLELLASLTCE